MNDRTTAQTILFFRSPQRRTWPAEEKLDGVYRFARARNWRVQVLDTPLNTAAARSAIGAWEPAGVLVDMDTTRPIYSSSVFGSLPTVFLDFDPRALGRKALRVNHDAETVGALAARHLSSLGYASYAFVGYTKGWYWSAARRDAFRTRLGAQARRFGTFEFATDGVSPAARERFERWLGRLPRPCAILLACDALAEELYPACRKIGLGIPNDIAVLGIDDDERLCNNLEPRMSSIRLDFAQAGWVLAEALDQALTDPTIRSATCSYQPLGIAPRESTSGRKLSSNLLAERLQRRIAEADDLSIGIPALIAGLGCSRRTAEVHFRATTGESLLTALRRRRMDLATVLLSDRQPLAAVLARCGYASASHFQADFKRHTGKTVAAWQNGPCR